MTWLILAVAIFAGLFAVDVAAIALVAVLRSRTAHPHPAAAKAAGSHEAGSGGVAAAGGVGPSMIVAGHAATANTEGS